MAKAVGAEVEADALKVLSGSGVHVDVVCVDASARPGLYALHASPGTWRELGLGDPPDQRPLYVGKSQQTLASRDVAVHFAMRARGSQSPTGSSTLRRSLAALLANERGYQAVPRNLENPGHFANYGLLEAHDSDLTNWMRHRLRLVLWPHEPVGDLDGIETTVLRELEPPLNISKVVTPWREVEKAARARMAADARDWPRFAKS
jgi:hypothetical protein